MELLEKLGINPVLLITQIINFIILLFILKRFLYKPILEMLEKRRAKIADGLKNAKEIEEKLRAAKRIEEERLREVKERTREILGEAKERAEKMRTEILKKSEDEAGQILEKAKAEIRNEKLKMLGEVKKEAADLMTAAVVKILESQLDKNSQRKIVERAVKEIDKVYRL